MIIQIGELVKSIKSNVKQTEINKKLLIQPLKVKRRINLTI